MVQSRTCVQKVARCRLCVVLPFRCKRHRWARKTGPYQEDQVICRLSSTSCIRLDRGTRSLAVLFGACGPHLDTVIACARSQSPLRPLGSGTLMSVSKISSGRPRFSGDQINQVCVFDVSHCTELPSDPYLDFYCPQRLSAASLWAVVMISRISTRHKDRSFSPVCKACDAYAVSI